MKKKLLVFIIVAIISIGGATLYYLYSNKEDETPIRGTFIKNQNLSTVSDGDAYEYYLCKSCKKGGYSQETFGNYRGCS